MKLIQRKVLYATFGLGAVVGCWVAIWGLALSIGSLNKDLLQAAGGVIGVASGLLSIINLPIASWIARTALTLGISAGCASAISVLVLDMYSSPTDFERDLLNQLWGLYVVGFPVVVGIALLFEFWWPRSKDRNIHAA
jgi:hypothetical protein